MGVTHRFSDQRPSPQNDRENGWRLRCGSVEFRLVVLNRAAIARRGRGLGAEVALIAVTIAIAVAATIAAVVRARAAAIVEGAGRGRRARALEFGTALLPSPAVVRRWAAPDVLRTETSIAGAELLHAVGARRP